MHRREFIRVAGGGLLFGAASTAHGAEAQRDTESKIITVRGPRPASTLGCTLPHEHVLVDFIGAAEISPARYDADAAFAKIKPFLEAVKAQGCATMFECTPAFLGRDPRLLVRLSEATGLNLVTNTGYYAARQHKFLPAHALTADADTLAAGWIRESRDGIEGTGVRPGFIKLGFDAGPLTDQGRKLIRAAATTHRETGLTIAAHTGDDIAAREQLAILRDAGVRAEAWIWVHAQNSRNPDAYADVTGAGGWLSFDGIAPNNLARYVQLLTSMKQQGRLAQVLISQDAGWYRPGEPDGGRYRDHEALFRAFLPALRREGFTDPEVEQLTVTNPARAFAVRKRIG